MATTYDLEERLLAFEVAIIRFTEKLPKSFAGKHIGGQLLRAGTAPMAPLRIGDCLKRLTN